MSAPQISWSDLGPRLLSAAVIVATIAVGLQFGGYVWAALVAVVFAGVYREWEEMVTLKPVTPLGAALIGLVAAAALLYPAFGWVGPATGVALAAGVALLGARDVVGWRVGGLVLCMLVVITAQALRGIGPWGIVAGWYLGLVIAFNDSGAYFVGRMVGGAKLAPTISPAKTVSGAVGGWLLGTVAGTVVWMVATPSPWPIGIALSALLGLVGQGGDLAESAIKRVFRVKDSGDIIPGHGGLMDRLDSVGFGVVAFFLIGVSRGGLEGVASGFLLW